MPFCTLGMLYSKVFYKRGHRAYILVHSLISSKGGPSGLDVIEDNQYILQMRNKITRESLPSMNDYSKVSIVFG